MINVYATHFFTFFVGISYLTLCLETYNRSWVAQLVNLESKPKLSSKIEACSSIV